MKIRKAAITAMSDGLNENRRQILEELVKVLGENGIKTVEGKYLFEDAGLSLAEKKAVELEGFMKDESVDCIFDVSGGDSANLALPYMNFDSFTKPFFGYSDLTVIINAALKKTGRGGYLYQIRNILGSGSAVRLFFDWIDGEGSLETLSYEMIRGEEMKGQVVGGNLRCLLKLAGTEFFPDTAGKILFLETRSGGYLRVMSMMMQLIETGALENTEGILIGQTTELERRNEREKFIQDVLSVTDCPVCITSEIGHSRDSKLIEIGKEYRFSK